MIIDTSIEQSKSWTNGNFFTANELDGNCRRKEGNENAAD